MKKYYLVVMFMFFAYATNAQSFVDKLHFETTIGTGIKNNGITPLDFSFNAHFDVISKMYAFASTETNFSYYNKNEIKTYSKGQSLGGGLGVKLLGKKSTSHALDARMKVLTNIGHADLSRTSYDASLVWYIKRNKALFSPVVEFGYRFIDYRTKGFDNYNNVYLSLGLRY